MLYICICMHIHVYVHVYTCMYMHMYVCVCRSAFQAIAVVASIYFLAVLLYCSCLLLHVACIWDLPSTLLFNITKLCVSALYYSSLKLEKGNLNTSDPLPYSCPISRKEEKLTRLWYFLLAWNSIPQAMLFLSVFLQAMKLNISSSWSSSPLGSNGSPPQYQENKYQVPPYIG